MAQSASWQVAAARHRGSSPSIAYVSRAVKVIVCQRLERGPAINLRVRSGFAAAVSRSRAQNVRMPTLLKPPSSRLTRLVAKCYPFGMSQPVKLSDELVLDARTVGAVARRSIAGQIEF